MEYLKPHIVLPHFDIKQGMSVVELHAGSGFFTPLVSEAVGSYGAVYPLNYNEEETYIDLPNTNTTVDRVLAINVPTSTNQNLLLSKAYTILRSEGRLIFINTHPLSEESTIHIAGLAGFIKEKRFYAGDYHFGLVFKKV